MQGSGRRRWNCGGLGAAGGSYLCLGSLLLFTSYLQCYGQQHQQSEEFAPSVTARCERGVMTIAVSTLQPFHGVVHSRDYRKEPCLAYGNGFRNTTLKINLLANTEDDNFCGIIINKGSQKRSVAVAVRVHKTLELSEDKFYLVSCGNSGFRNARNEFSRVSLNFVELESQKKVTELIYGHQYALRARVSKPDGQYDIRVKNCISFAPNTTDVQLLDANGCPVTSFLSEFRFNQSEGTADSTLYSTFRFPNNNKVHIQCQVELCKGNCGELSCSSNEVLPRASARTRNNTDDGQVVASTSVFVVEPGEFILAEGLTECTEWRFPWLIGLCICLAILLLVMLIVNIFLCSSLSCTCTKTEVEEKEPSEMEDYDPYRVGWAPSSHYGSRTSLNKHGYTSGGSTLNSTARSVSNGSDHYAIVHSRPGSRYSQHSSKEPLHRSGPGSHYSNGAHYNSRI